MYICTYMDYKRRCSRWVILYVNTKKHMCILIYTYIHMNNHLPFALRGWLTLAIPGSYTSKSKFTVSPLCLDQVQCCPCASCNPTFSTLYMSVTPSNMCGSFPAGSWDSVSAKITEAPEEDRVSGIMLLSNLKEFPDLLECRQRKWLITPNPNPVI